MSRTHPDIAFPFDNSRICDENIAVIAVRPETNKVTYESAILKGIAPYSDLIYMANFSGTVVRTSKIIESQYASQLEFATNGKKQLRKYPEMIARIEEKFKISIDHAPIFGSYQFCKEISLSDETTCAQELFNTIVPQEDFLEIHGQTVKKIGAAYIINYDIPAILMKHNQNTDIFVIAIRCKDQSTDLAVINHDIYQQLLQKQGISLIDADKREKMEWFNKVRRTYHISNSPAKAMFDLTDYILDNDKNHLSFDQTPLGHALLSQNIATINQLQQLKKSPIIYIHDKNGNKRLTNIINECNTKKDKKIHQKTISECCDIFKKIYWEK